MKDHNNQPAKRDNNNFRIVGLNLLTLAIYTVIFKFQKDTGFLLDAFVILIHFILCLVFAVVNQNKSAGLWILSACLILAIGFSTCVYVIHFN